MTGFSIDEVFSTTFLQTKDTIGLIPHRTVESEIINKIRYPELWNLQKVLAYCAKQLRKVLSKSIQRKLRNPNLHYQAISVVLGVHTD